jgi:hypothetical protein
VEAECKGKLLARMRAGSRPPTQLRRNAVMQNDKKADDEGVTLVREGIRTVKSVDFIL